ncbi:armadillo repeat-containing protein 1-like [Haliotis rubra]|uniref:armadillo repeat-containing protein 1-like n=1 Tax=Haliotis rubra TaxID=36100 RepID=UPI001EE4EC0A|nr:armadillo repeat-containing protein 1-like [Haliotis rubra]XP_046566804.1 armadillo repeat-containing protein 1-like [Haliotis rubra]
MVTTDAISAMKALATDPTKRAALAKDATCVGGLVVVLSNSDTKVVKLALETLLLLVESGENVAPLKDFMGMLDQLEALMNRSDGEPELRELTEKLYLILTEVEQQTPLRDTSNIHSSRRNSSSCSKKSNKSLSYHSHKHKSVILQLRGITDRSDRELCMKLLLQVKGVISITFDMNKKRSILRVKNDVKPESLVQAVARSQTMAAQQVVRDDNGEELFLSFRSLMEDAEKENSDMPSYLADDADSPVIDDKAISRTAREEKKGGGWLSSAASFLTNSFYW